MQFAAQIFLQDRQKLSFWISDEEGNQSLLRWLMWIGGQKYTAIALGPVLFSFSLQDLVRLASRKVPEWCRYLRQEKNQNRRKEIVKKSTRKGSSKLWTWTYLAPASNNLCWAQVLNQKNQELASTPLHEAFSSSGRLTGDWLSRVSNLAHLRTMGAKV